MKRFKGKVDDDGRIAVPRDVLEHLGAKPGDSLVIAVQDEGTITVRRTRYPTIASLRGAAGSIDSNLTVAEMIELAREDRILGKFGRREP